jgi:hypothetical protein
MNNALDTALYNVLSGGTALTGALGGTFIYYAQAPRDRAMPYVIYNVSAATEDNESPRRTQRAVYLVKAVAATMLQAGTIAGHIDTLLHDATLSPTGYINFWTARETIVHYVEVDAAGNTIAHQGGEYAVRVTQQA